MEGAPNNQTQILPDSKIELGDIALFGNFLFESRAKSGKSRAQISQELGEMTQTIMSWEAKRDIISFPDPAKLPAIAVAYGVDLPKLVWLFELSFKARKIGKSSRISLKKGMPKR